VQTYAAPASLEPPSGVQESFPSAVNLPEEAQTFAPRVRQPAAEWSNVSHDDYGPQLDPVQAANQWRETLQRAIRELRSSHVVLCLQLGGLGLPQGVPRPTDVGIRLPAAAGASDSFRLVYPYQDVIESLQDLGVNEDEGWSVVEMGCSLFAHGPLVSFTVASMHQGQPNQKMHRENLLQRVVPVSKRAAAQSVASGSGIETSIRAGLKGGELQLGARFEFREEQRRSSNRDLQSMAVDLALGREKVFDAFMIERTRQMFASMGGRTVVSAIECRANDMALVTLNVSPEDRHGMMQI
jgi:hypothetical protein